MDEDERPRRRSPEVSLDGDVGAACLLASESLERYSLDELDARITLLEAEIARIRDYRQKYTAHRSAAEALFRRKTP